MKLLLFQCLWKLDGNDDGLCRVGKERGFSEVTLAMSLFMAFMCSYVTTLCGDFQVVEHISRVALCLETSFMNFESRIVPNSR